MKQLTFHTNIKCMGCISTVTPALDETVGAGNWEVNLQAPDKLLTVKGELVEQEKVVAALARVGYKAEPA